MSKFHALLAMASICLTGEFAQAQHCADGKCSIGPRRSGESTSSFDSGYQFSRYQPLPGLTNGSQHQSFSNFQSDRAGRLGEVCRDCNDHGCQCGVGEADYRTGNYSPGETYVPRSNFGPRSDYDLRSRSDFDVRSRTEFDRRQPPAYSQPSRSDFEPRLRSDFNRYDDRPRTRDFDRGFERQNLRPRNEYPGLRYPENGRTGTQFNYTSTGPRNTVQWQSDLRRAADFAKAQRRPMFVTIGADWCTHCKRMKAGTFRDNRFAQGVSRGGFVTVMLDADQNQSVVSRLGIRSLPTTLIVAPNMQIVERLEGYRTAEQFTLSLSRHSRSAENTSDVKVAAK